MKVRLITNFLIVAMGIAPLYMAQGQRATLRGVVVDPSKLPVPGAKILCVNEETSDSRTTQTNAAGEFILPTLGIGAYRLEVEQTGYKKYVHRFDLSVNQDLRLTVALEVGSLQESVAVSAPNAPLHQDSISLGSVVQNAQVSNLPLDGRNFLELSLLLPGAVPAAPGSASSVRGDFSFSVSGSREGTNTFLLDGMSNVDPKLNTLGIQPPVDAIREFEMLTSTPDASFGRNSGSQVNVVLKSGTNAFHGTVYEFVRNGALDARNYFAPQNEPAPAYERNQFGFSLGGPIKTNKTFFFVDYEGTRSLEGLTRISNVPTLAERSGDFSQSLFPKPINPYTQQPFPGDIVPTAYQSPIGQAMAALYPLPNRATRGQNFVSSPESTNRVDQFDARIDQELGKQSSLTFRYSFGDGYLYEPFSGSGFATVPGFGTSIPKRAQNLVITETHTFSPTILNEARFGFGRTALGSFQENMGTSLNRAVGLPELSDNPRDWGLSFITVTGYSPLGDEYNNPQHSVTNTYTASDNLTWARNRHLFKMGGDFHVIQQNAYRDIQARGLITFSSSVPITGNALADMLLGYPIFSGGAEINNAQHLRTNGFSLYFQDTYQLRPNLTLLMGIRYEHNAPPYDAFNRAGLYDPATQSILNLGSGSMPRAGRYADWNDWAPRVGIAWTPRGNGTLVVRAGYGIYYDQFALAPGEGIYFNPPYYNLNFYFPLPGLPLTLNDPFPESFPYQSPSSAQAIQRNLQTPYVQQWNLNVQAAWEIDVFEVAYVGSKGTKLCTRPGY
ncbi:MAG: TonB-dependent receptor [Terriglobia bacterium]